MRLMPRVLVTAVLAVPVLLAGGLPASATPERAHHSTALAVVGSVDAPHSYSRSELAALPQTTLTDQRRPGGHVLSGVLLQSLVDDAEPQLPDAKNAALRVTAIVAGRGPKVAVARGELDPNLGNHPALLVLARDGRGVRGAPELVFPGDTNRVRTVRDVRRIAVAVAPAATTLPAEGSVLVVSGRRQVVVSAARLAALPQRTRTVSFLAKGSPQTHVETGPTLAAVLRAAQVRSRPATSVAASATDGYVAAVTPGEASSGGRPLLLSLVEDGTSLSRPRLVVDGDVFGGRYVSDVTTLTVTGARRQH